MLAYLPFCLHLMHFQPMLDGVESQSSKVNIEAAVHSVKAEMSSSKAGKLNGVHYQNLRRYIKQEPRADVA